MNLFRIALVTFLCLSAALLWAADPFWELRPFTEWSDFDVSDMLEDSPWSAPHDLILNQKDLEGAPAEIKPERGSVTATLRIRWHSALPVRQALVKYRYGDEAGTPGGGQSFLQQASPFYVISVSNMPVHMAQAAEAAGEEFKNLTYLQRKGKEPLHPENIEVHAAGPWAEIRLFFPRSVAISVEDKNIELVTELGRHKVKQRFRLRDMVYRGNLEL